MMKGINYHINMDKLEICYIAKKEIVDELEDTEEWYLDSFRIIKKNKEERNSKSEYNIDILYNDEANFPLEWVRFATLIIGNSFEKDGDENRYVWIRLANKTHYTKFTYNTNIVGFVYHISETLNLNFNNITKMDIAIDSNINFFKRIRTAVRNSNYVPFILGEKHSDMKARIKKLGYYLTGNRERYLTGQIIINNSEKTLGLSCYNKSIEIEDNKKKYIEKHENSKCSIYRSEVKLKKRIIVDYLEYKHITFEDLYYNIGNNEYLFDMFLYFANRLIRFKCDRGFLSILEI